MSWKESLRPLISATDHFLRSPATQTHKGPHIRDFIDVKRWMILVVIALFPCILAAIWNTGVQAFVYSSGSAPLMDIFLKASESWQGYWSFTTAHWRPILWKGMIGFLPYVAISYGVGGIWETIFACVRKHDIAEGFLVTGILYALILPPTLPYWMAALGISVGIILSKELFGGTGMNILNPALVCRCFLFFAFPAYMTGEVWVGRNLAQVRESVLKMDGISQASALAVYNLSSDVKRVHVDAIMKGKSKNTVTETLGLSADNYREAQEFIKLKQGVGKWNDWGLFLGNKIGSMGEVSILASLLGAAFLIGTGIGSWRTMAAVFLGAAVTALAFEYGSRLSPWSPAQFDFPMYKQFLMGGLAFGLVFMATDPVSSPVMNGAKWAYGFLIGMLTIVIRAINPAFPEGIMLAILFGNVFAPLFDFFALRIYRRKYVL